MDLLRRWTKETPYLLPIELYLATGSRPRELFAIQKSDVDFAKGTIHIPGTKTKLSNRYVPLFEKTIQLLKQIDFSVNGNLLDIRYEHLCKFLREFNSKHKTNVQIKDFRTTFATQCAQHGVAQKVLAKWMGHSKIETTSKYYVKVLPEFELAEIRKIDTID